MFKLSSQGCCNDLSALTTVASTAVFVQKVVMMAAMATFVAMTLAPTNMAVKTTMTVDSPVTVTHMAVTTLLTVAMMASHLHTVAAPAL